MQEKIDHKEHTENYERYTWYNEMTHSDEEKPQYQLNPLTRKQEELIHPNHLKLLKEVVET